MSRDDFEKTSERVGQMRLPDIGHADHLCVIWTLNGDVEMIGHLVNYPKFICKICGRSASEAKSLCEPTT